MASQKLLAVSNSELYMIPGIIKFNEIVGDLLCVNLYNFKFNVLNLNSEKTIFATSIFK